MLKENNIGHWIRYPSRYLVDIMECKLVCNGAASEPLLGRPVLEALRMNTSDILAAAADRYNGSLCLSHLCIESEWGRIARVYDGFNHSDHGTDDDESDEEELWLYLEEDKD